MGANGAYAGFHAFVAFDAFVLNDCSNLSEGGEAGFDGDGSYGTVW